MSLVNEIITASGSGGWRTLSILARQTRLTIGEVALLVLENVDQFEFERDINGSTLIRAKKIE